MPAKLIEQKDNRVTIQLTVELTGQMLRQSAERDPDDVCQECLPTTSGARTRRKEMCWSSGIWKAARKPVLRT